MRKLLATILAAAALLFPTYVRSVSGHSAAANLSAEKIPKDVLDAERLLSKWVNGFKTQNADQVREALGEPASETVWLFQEKKEPLLKFKVGGNATLSLYFHKDRVVKGGLHFLP
jgi:hypothetical protein